MEGGHALVIERDLAADKDIEHNTKTPNINFRAGVDLGVEEFRGGKIEGATKRRQMREWVVQV